MDKKFSISFYPKDSSRVKVLSFSRRLGIWIAILLLTLAAAGTFLVMAGNLHEPEAQKELRLRLEAENKVLAGRVEKLDQDLHGLRSNLNSLEGQKVNALMLTGVEYSETEKEKTDNRLFAFFHRMTPLQTDIAASLAQAQKTSAYLDSILKMLESEKSLVENMPTGYPVAAEALVTREFGYSPDPFTGRKALHAGIDFSLRAGASVFASGGGEVETVEKDLLWGNCIRIHHGRGIYSFYAHLQDLFVHQGETVSRGEVIGTMGMTGIASGVHLHYELTVKNSKTDPLAYFLPKVMVF